MAVQAAIRTRSFINSIGVNTHIDFVNYGYQNLTTVAASIGYLGIKNIRDSAQTAADATTWLQVANATGAKFDDYIAETSPAGMATDLGFATQLAQAGITGTQAVSTASAATTTVSVSDHPVLVEI